MRFFPLSRAGGLENGENFLGQEENGAAKELALFSIYAVMYLFCLSCFMGRITISYWKIPSAA